MADLAGDPDAGVRAAAMRAMARRRHPQAGPRLAGGTRDVDLGVRLAAIAGLGEVGGSESVRVLEGMMTARGEAIRAAAVSALAAAGADEPVMAAAKDKAWQVRAAVAAALPRWPDARGVQLARQLLDDQSTEVQQRRFGGDRRLAARAGGAHPAGRAGQGPDLDAADRRREARRAMARRPGLSRTGLGREPGRGPGGLDRAHSAASSATSRRRPPKAPGRRPRSPGRSRRSRSPGPKRSWPSWPIRVWRRAIGNGRWRGWLSLGRTCSRRCRSWRSIAVRSCPRRCTRTFCPRTTPCSSRWTGCARRTWCARRRAASDLAQRAADHPLGRLAVARLAGMMAEESDALVWRSVLMAVAADASEPAIRLAYTAIGNPAPEVRRRACENLAARPSPRHVKVLLPALADPSEPVARAAIAALVAGGRLDDTRPLRQLLATPNEPLRVEAAAALARFGDPAGVEALGRLAYSRDVAVRQQVAQAMGDLADPRFARP